MSTAQPTFGDIRLLFQETERLMKDLFISQKETDRKFQETDRKFQETDRKFQETDRKFQETDRKIKELSKNLGDIGNRLGEFVEHMVEPTVVRLFQAQGVAVHEVHSGVQAERNGEGIEIDLLVVNEDVVVAVECKSKLTEEHVNLHVLRMEKLKRMLPAYRHHQAFGAVAAMVVPADIARYAQQQGLYVLAQRGESIEVRNDADFCAKAW
ncbi:DUF3782 domain-containing protein [Gammaproteobacteria bacterium]